MAKLSISIMPDEGKENEFTIVSPISIKLVDGLEGDGDLTLHLTDGTEIRCTPITSRLVRHALASYLNR